MKNKDYSYLYSNWEDTVRRRKVFLSNPVFVKGLALAPLVVAATTVHNGILLCIAVFFLLTPTRIVTNLITRHMSMPLKTFFYPFICRGRRKWDFLWRFFAYVRFRIREKIFAK